MASIVIELHNDFLPRPKASAATLRIWSERAVLQLPEEDSQSTRESI